jgi:hypothetical protein
LSDPDFEQKRKQLFVPGLEKLMALENLEKIGPAGRPLLGDLRSFAEAENEDLFKKSALRLIGELDPGSRQHSPEIDDVLRLDEERKEWAEKWRSQALTLDDLMGALKDNNRLGMALPLLQQMGAAAKAAVPQLIALMPGRDDDARNQIIATIHAIDPSVQIDLVRKPIVQAAVDAAYGAIQKGDRSDTQTAALLKIFEGRSMTQLTYKEMNDLAVALGAQDEEVRRAFVDKAVEMDGKLKQVFAAEP